jgi:hypothetical protein
MGRPTLTVGDVFRRYGDAYRAEAGPLLSPSQRRVMTAIEQCRTAALGGHVEQCDRCGHTRIWYNSCVMESPRFWGVSRKAGAHTGVCTPDRLPITEGS